MQNDLFYYMIINEKLTISYDMAWQNISSERRYEYCTVNKVIIGDITQEIIGMVMYFNTFKMIYA